MSNGEKNIDKIFRDRLRNFDAVPPVEVWDNIRETLHLQRRKGIILWIGRVAAGIAILTALSLSYFIIRKPATDRLISGDKTKAEQGIAASENDSSSAGPSEIRSEANILLPVKSGELNKQPRESQYTETVTAMTDLSQKEKLNYIKGRSLRQLDINLTGPETGLLHSRKQYMTSPEELIAEKNPAEDLYALNISEENQKTKNRWAVGTEISPLYSYRSLEGKNNEARVLADNFNQSESGVMAYSGGVNVNYSPLRRLTLQSGVYYSRYGVNVGNAYMFENATADVPSSAKFYSINYSSGIIDIGSDPLVDYVTNKNDRIYYSTGSPNLNSNTLEVNSGEITQNFEYIEVPLILRYRLIDRKIGFNLLGGLSTNLLIGSNTYYRTKGNREKIGETTDIKPFNYSSVIGLGLDYEISKHLYINMEPTFRYYLNSINQSSVIRSYPYSIGVFTGLRYNF
jgi:hypothetical protein